MGAFMIRPAALSLALLLPGATTALAQSDFTGSWEVAVREFGQKNFYLPMAEGAKAPANEFFGNSGIGMAASAATFEGTAKDFLSYVIENYADRYVEKKALSPLRFELKEGVTYDPLFVAVKTDADNYGAEFAKPWDTLLSPDGNQIVNDLAFQLANDQITAEQFVDGLGQVK